MTNINKPIRNVSFVLVSYVFAYVHFLHFGELKKGFLHIAPFPYRKYNLPTAEVWRLVFVDLKYIRVQTPHFPRATSSNILIGNTGLYI